MTFPLSGVATPVIGSYGTSQVLGAAISIFTTCCSSASRALFSIAHCRIRRASSTATLLSLLASRVKETGSAPSTIFDAFRASRMVAATRRLETGVGEDSVVVDGAVAGGDVGG